MEQKYMKLERELAILLGYRAVLQQKGSNRLVALKDGKPCVVPAWSRDPVEALALMARHNCFPCQSAEDEKMGFVRAGCNGGAVVELVNQHASKEDALLYATVRAVVRKLAYEAAEDDDLRLVAA